MIMAAPDINAARRRWFAAAREAGLDDDARKAVQMRIAAKASSSAMSVADFNACLTDLKSRGLWAPAGVAKPGKTATWRKKSDKAHVRKVFAIWGDLCRADIPAKPDRASLLAFVKRMTGVDDPEWLTPAQANQVVEGLKAWRGRHG